MKMMNIHPSTYTHPTTKKPPQKCLHLIIFFFSKKKFHLNSDSFVCFKMMLNLNVSLFNIQKKMNYRRKLQNWVDDGMMEVKFEVSYTMPELSLGLKWI